MKNKKIIIAFTILFFFTCSGIIYSVLTIQPPSEKEEKDEWTHFSEIVSNNQETVVEQEENEQEISDQHLQTKVKDTEDIPVSEALPIYVHVCGAVKTPGVYSMPSSSRVVDAVESAGGFLPGAAQDYLNQAASIIDGMRLYIPTEQEIKNLSYEDFLMGQTFTKFVNEDEKGAMESTGTSKININIADKNILMTLPGIGDAKAEGIIKYREEKGNFKSIEEVMKVDGIKQAAFEKLKDKIKVK